MLAEKKTQAAKNRVARATAAVQAGSATIRKLRDDMLAARQALVEAKQAGKKYQSMEKAIARFEREWERASAPSKKVRRRKKAVAAAAVVSAAESTVQESGGK